MNERNDSASWRGLASKFESKLEALKIQLSEKDRHLLGDLQDLDLRCQTVFKLIEDLSGPQASLHKREDMGPPVGRLLAEVKGLNACTQDVVGPLERLLASIHAGPTSRSREEKRGQSR